MTQRELITHFINRLRFRWNRAVSTATWHPTNFCLTRPPRAFFVQARTVASYTDKYIARTPACMLFFHFFFCLYLHSLSLSCRCFISQLGEYLNVIMTFAIKSKQRGWIEERMPDLPLSTLRVPLHVECFFDCSGVFFLTSLSNGRRFSYFYGQIYWHEHLLWGSTGPRGLVSEWKTSLSLSVYLQYNHSPFGLCVNEDDFISSGKFDPILRNASADGTSERYNWVNELHALICCSFIRAARGVTTISLLHRLLYVWWVPWRENLIMQSNFLKANCFDSWKQGRRGLSSAFLFFFLSVALVLFFYNEYLNIIVIYLSRLSVQLHRAIFRLISSQAGGRRGI